MSFLTRIAPLSLFPIFLVPSAPFHRHHSSLDTGQDKAATGQSPSSQATVRNDGYLNGHTSYLRCARCASDLCPTSQIISKGFTGRHGRAYLVSASPVTDAAPFEYHLRHAKNTSLPNTRTHKPMPRQLVTGAHTVSDVSCAFCGSVIGWKYEWAEEETQRYKVGKYILETKKIFSSSCWEKDDDQQVDSATGHSKGTGQKWDGSIEFDSQDEDECEDLFAGMWSPSLAVKRRQGRRFGRPAIDQPTRTQP
ncbi:MAG: hypothetical protein L6R37_003532 [Teloschistes peruensis]|nr:MAG: hypothetical protein L6R37_003532 [Teloschistes peruensis]